MASRCTYKTILRKITVYFVVNDMKQKRWDVKFEEIHWEYFQREIIVWRAGTCQAIKVVGFQREYRGLGSSQP